MQRRSVLKGMAATAVAGFSARRAVAQDTIKIGMCLALTGGFQTVGRQCLAGAKLYLARNGDEVAGRKVELIVKDDRGIGDVARRLVQEMIVNDGINIVGAGITPSALAITSLVTEAKMPGVVMISGTSIVVDRSPYLVRTGFTLGQSSGVLGTWAANNGHKRVVTLSSDWAPGVEAERAFKDSFVRGGGEIIESLRVPLSNPDFSPFLQKAHDLAPDTVFISFPGQQAGAFTKQFAERGLDRSGIRIIGPGDLTDDDELPHQGDVMIGVITAHHYSTAHPSAMNNDYVAAFKAANGFRPNFISVGGYDAMHLIYEALKKTNGDTGGDALIAAMKGMAWESPRGPMSIDPDTRDVIQNEYIRKVEKVNGELFNIEFATIENVKDPIRGMKKA
jgi:branched-chain amino acid transport system substrate-binding protein